MKNILITFTIFATLILIAAELNYSQAITRCMESNGADSNINGIMEAHGFNVPLTKHPSTVTKIKALCTRSGVDYSIDIHDRGDGNIIIYTYDDRVIILPFDSLQAFIIKDNE